MQWTILFNFLSCDQNGRDIGLQSGAYFAGKCGILYTKKTHFLDLWVELDQPVQFLFLCSDQNMMRYRPSNRFFLCWYLWYIYTKFLSENWYLAIEVSKGNIRTTQGSWKTFWFWNCRLFPSPTQWGKKAAISKQEGF